MEKELGKNIEAGNKRIAFLLDNCDTSEDKEYTKQYSVEELTKLKESLSETEIRISDLEEELHDTKADFKERLKPLYEDRVTTLDGLKRKARLVTEKCYKFIDQKAREVGYYNEAGDLIECRQAYADELQGNLFKPQFGKTGTANAS
ncbi:MAG: hypothetical protein LKK08_06125 [Bacteroidales bacterium]|nr:hypothetical protein [Bacteroidales bacterium]